MIVKVFKSGEKLDVNESFGTRLIEQGKAEAVPTTGKASPKATEAKTADAPAPKKGKAAGDA